MCRGYIQINSCFMHEFVPVDGKGAETMGQVIAFVVFGLIGVAVLGVVVYIGGMLLSGPAILVDETIKEIKHLQDKRAEHAPGS